MLAGALLLAPAGLAACGSVHPRAVTAAGAASQSAAAARATPAHLVLCADPAAASRVVISRTMVTRQIQPLKSLPPAQVSVAAGNPARSLARALCALPRMPKGTFSCPALLFGHVTLTFTVAGRRLPAVTIQPTGCQSVTGLGPVRWVAKSPGFWAVLARAAGTTGPVRFPYGPAGVTGCGPNSARLRQAMLPCPVGTPSGSPVLG